MTSSINSVSQSPGTSESAGPASGPAGVRPAETAPAAADITLAPGEAVTVSADAETTTQLLDAARGADGVDQTSVARLRGAVQDGSYDVSPDNLARAITGALKETT